MNYFICGFMGSGKTTLLQELSGVAELQKYHGLDLDQYIVSTIEENSIESYIERHDFDKFRLIELEALKRLSLQDNLIIALGGGSLCEASMEYLKNWKGFWLDTPLKVCLARIRAGTGRPLAKLSDNDLTQLYHERLKNYQKYPPIISKKDFCEYLSNTSS